MTLDGKTAAASGDSRWISGAPVAGPGPRAPRPDGRDPRRASAPPWPTTRSSPPAPPARGSPPRVVLDSAARLPVDSRLARTAREVPVLVAVTDRAPAERRAALEALGCEVLAFPGDGPVPIVPLLDELGRRGMTNVLVEGGGRVLGAFLDAGQVDAVDVFLAPILEGGRTASRPARGPGSIDDGRGPPARAAARSA